MQSLWWDARVEHLDGLTEDGENYPVDDFRCLKSGSRAQVCRGLIALAGGSKGAKPTGKFRLRRGRGPRSTGALRKVT